MSIGPTAAPAPTATPDPAPAATPSEPAGFSEAALAQPAPQASPPAPPTTPPIEPPAPTEAVSFRDALSEKGHDLSQFQDDEALLKHIEGQLKLAEQVPQLQQSARYMEYLAPYADKIEQLVQAESQPGTVQTQPAVAPAPTEPVAEADYWDKSPEWDPAWREQITTETAPDGSQTLVCRAGARPDLVTKYHARRDWEQRQSDKLLEDPAAAVRPGLKSDFDALREDFRTIAREELNTYRQQQYDNAFVMENQEWLYQKGADGQPLIDQQTGQSVLSSQGMAFGNIASQLGTAGLDPALVPQVAMQLALGTPLGQQTSPASVPNPSVTPVPGQAAPSTAEAHKEQFLTTALRGAGHVPNRAGTLAPGSEPNPPAQNSELDARAMLTQVAKQMGVQF